MKTLRTLLYGTFFTLFVVPKSMPRIRKPCYSTSNSAGARIA